MYLEPIQSFSAAKDSMPLIPPTFQQGVTNQFGSVMCNNGTFDPTPVDAKTLVPLCTGRGGVKYINPPTMPPKPKFKTAYSLTGTLRSKNWFYPACKTGYTKQQVNKPHPQMYSCFDPAELAWNKKYGIVM